MTDDSVKLLGTVRMNLVDSVNREYLRAAIAVVKKMNQGSWSLCQAFNKTGQEKEVAENCGYILFKDKIVVIF